MPPTPLRLRDVAHALADAAEHTPSFGWYVARGNLPNGRYLVHHLEGKIWLDRRLTGDEYFTAFVEAVAELTGRAADDADVVPIERMHSHRRGQVG